MARKLLTYPLQYGYVNPKNRKPFKAKHKDSETQEERVSWCWLNLLADNFGRLRLCLISRDGENKLTRSVILPLSVLQAIVTYADQLRPIHQLSGREKAKLRCEDIGDAKRYMRLCRKDGEAKNFGMPKTTKLKPLSQKRKRFLSSSDQKLLRLLEDLKGKKAVEEIKRSLRLSVQRALAERKDADDQLANEKLRAEQRKAEQMERDYEESKLFRDLPSKLRKQMERERRLKKWDREQEDDLHGAF